MEKLKIEYVDIESIKPYKNNAKLHPKEQIEQIKNSIEMFGMDDPIGIWKDEIVEGHGRLIACKELGMTEVPIIRLDHLTDEERKAYTLAHNKLTMNSDFDIDILNDELMNFETIDMEKFGFNLDLNIDIQTDIIEDEFDPEEKLKEEPKSKPGDIYQLGNHRLMCGDSTKEEDVDKLMNGKKIQLLVTDPPYNVDLGEINKAKVNFAPERYKGANTDNIANDKMNQDDFVIFLSKAFYNADKHLEKGRSFYIWHSCTENYNFQTAMLSVGWKVRQQLIWNKSSLCLGLSDYQWKHEPCFYGWKEGAGHYFTKDRTNSTVIDEEDKIEKMSKNELIEMIRTLIQEIPSTVIDEHKPTKSEEHPTMKPIKLISRSIVNSSKENENVLDIFGGSGTTLMACEQLNRNCYMMEYDPVYVDVIIERWENFTGQKAEKIN